jgi:hypothetical protein
MAAAMIAYRFGAFELTPSRRQLLADGRETVVGGRAFDLPVALIEQRNRLVTKSELLSCGPMSPSRRIASRLPSQRSGKRCMTTGKVSG